MEYLGEFLSPQNTIGKDQDQLTKYFYFRPDNYDDPEADLENIFIIKAMDEFPKRLDLLSENNLYAIDSITVSKRISDEEIGVNKVSYVVTATYDLLKNIKKREEEEEKEEEETEKTPVDEDGNPVTSETPPWKLRATLNFQPIEVVVPFTKGFSRSISDFSWDVRDVDILNSAKCQMVAETKRYQIEITYQKNYENPQIWENILKPYVNGALFDFGSIDLRGEYPEGTLLLLPPTYQVQWHKEVTVEEGQEIHKWKRYYSYTVRIIYDPEGHDKKLLDVGTYALFGDDPVPRQIWEVTKVDNSTGSIISGYPKWLSAAEALKEQALALRDGQLITATPITEPVPLTSAGTIDEMAIKDPLNNRYRTLTFVQYAGRDFSDLPWKI